MTRDAPTEQESLARVYHLILTSFVREGRAPHYAELAGILGIGVEEARPLQRALLALGGPHWAHPGTDLVAGFAPFSNIATHYRVSVGGEQRWFAQCGMESLAVSWLFPGREVRIDAPCLCCGEPMALRMRDGIVLDADPATLVGHINHPPDAAITDWPYT
jgi:hypothetical protein